MRTIEWTSRFKRDYKREKKGPFRIELDIDLATIVALLAADAALEERHRDHALMGD